MSLVGPRPHAVEHNELYKSRIPKYMLRHKVKPGMTGWAQVNGFRGLTDSKEQMAMRIEHDLWYIQNWSHTLRATSTRHSAKPGPGRSRTTPSLWGTSRVWEMRGEPGFGRAWRV